MGALAVVLQLIVLILGLLLIIVILLQRGRGGGLAGAFGGQGGQSAFGTKAGDFFTRVTVVMATIWVVLSGISGLAMRKSVNSAARSGLPSDAAPENPGADLPVIPEIDTTPVGSTSGPSVETDPGASAIGPGVPNATGNVSVPPSLPPQSPVQTPAEPESSGSNAPALPATPPPSADAPASPAPEAEAPAVEKPAVEAPAAEGTADAPAKSDEAPKESGTP